MNDLNALKYLNDNLIQDNWVMTFKTLKSAIIGSLYFQKFCRFEDQIFYNGKLMIKFE